MPLCMEVGLGSGHIVLHGHPAPLPKKKPHPQFLAHVYCGQTAGLIKMSLGMELGLGSGHIVLDGDPMLPPKKKRQGAQPPNFRGPCLLWLNGWMDQDATCVTWGPSSPPAKGAQPLPQFSAHIYCGQTVAHLSYC